MGDVVRDTRLVKTPGIDMLLWCPECGERHVDSEKWASRPHHTHACQYCGHVWRPAIVNTIGAQFLPGCWDEPTDIEEYEEDG